MSDGTKIEWTDATWPVTRGCELTSAGCKNCYAMKMAHRFSGPGRWGHGLTVLGKHGARWNGTVRTVPEVLDKPLRWRKARRIFVSSTSDLFHPEVPSEYIAAVFGVMAACPQHTFQVLTKRPERMLEWFKLMGVRHTGHLFMSASLYGADVGPLDGIRWPLPNVHLGVSCENQEAADKRIRTLLQCPAAIHWLSLEPLIGQVDLACVPTSWRGVNGFPDPVGAFPRWQADNGAKLRDGVDWVVVGGESGPGARPCHVEWIRSIVEQCRDAGVPAFVKQLGADVRWDGTSKPGQRWPDPFLHEDTGDGSFRALLVHSKGGDPDEWREDLRVRQMPAGPDTAAGVAMGLPHVRIGENLAEAIGITMRIWRWRAGMTQEQVATGIGAFREVVCRLERGVHLPALRSVQGYARATGGDIRQVFDLVDRWGGVSVVGYKRVEAGDGE